MTIYICQCPHNGQAKVWTADDETAALDAINADFERRNSETSFDVLSEAAAYDQQDAYVTSDPLDLYLWISTELAPRRTRAEQAFFSDHSIVGHLREMMTRTETDDDTIYTAFDGEFRWSDDQQEWTLGNAEPVEADNVTAALCAAALARAKRDQIEIRDV